MKEGLRTLNNLLKQQGRTATTEVTRYKGELWLLHILRNGVPVPLYHSKDPAEIRKEIMK